MECEIIPRKWGHSLGGVFPKEVVEAMDIKENKPIRVIILKSDDTFRKTFGILKGKLKKTAQEIKDEIRADLYDD
ncbi:MAG TPA: hypothetical protein VJC07_02815 [Candidatus Nanoarchaeia archaeon]|nr:hypothetical protein [Candidatus Nanoarchaeia archaeon]